MKRILTCLLLFVFCDFGFFAQQTKVPESMTVKLLSAEKQELEKIKANERFFFENTIIGDWNSYRNLIINSDNESLKSAAEDSILSIGKRNDDLKILTYCVDNFRENKRSKALMVFHDVFTNDGEKQTLDLFYKNFDLPIFKDIKMQDYKLVILGDELNLENPYNLKDFEKYDRYIKLAAPSEKAFVALQRLIANNINKKEWRAALEKTKIYSSFFGKNNKKITDLQVLLSKKVDKLTKIYSAGNLINTAVGGEYLPVLTADEKLMYFCGRDRIDNIGGEDIFVSKKVNGNWDAGKLLTNLSSSETNDSPLSISSDGSMLLIFKSGILNYAERTISGWSKAIEFPRQINAGNWQADAMITSNGRGLIFASSKIGGENLFQHRQNYHGDILYPSDIYISLMNDKDEWGEPINLGNTINTRYCDRMPFLHPDMKTLYFSSDGHGGLGKMDIYKSTRLADSCWNCWSEPVNLGTEINTNESDADYKITTSGDKAFFSYEKITYFENSALFLLDVSGSMSGIKLEALKKATLTVGKKAIQNNTEVAILTFAGDCIHPIINVFPFSKNTDSLKVFTEKLGVLDDTPMYEAYLIACDYMKKNSSPISKYKTITLMTDGNATSCTVLNDVLKILTEKGEVYKTQSIAYDVPENSIAYNDLKQISSFSKGKFHPTNNFEELTSSFEGSIKEIFNVNSANYNKDIYWINLPQDLRPDKTSTASGKLVDKNNKPVSAKIRVEDLETGKIIGQSKSNPKDGSFFIVLPSGKIYGYYVDKDEYFPVSNSVDLQHNDEIIMINDDLKALKFNQIVDEGMIVPLNNIFFPFSKYNLHHFSIPELKRVASIIKKSGFKVKIMGHTDYIGEVDMNQILSEKRAQTVKDFLVIEGCESGKLITSGFGENNPVATNKNEIGRSRNRRVELKFIK